jgi:hypothetical protein
MNAAEKKTLDLYPIDYPFETLVKRIQDKKLQLDPDFQRDYKWDKDGWERSSKFIESCLMRIPLPSCYFAEDEQTNHMVIDGVQRLSTICRYFNDEFSLEGMTVFSNLEGKRFSEIGDYRSELENTTIRCIILRKSNPRSIVREIFSRLNQGAVALSAQEIRHAIYPGRLDSLLSELAKNPLIAEFGKGPASRAKKDSREGEEQVLRYFAFRGELESYDGRKLGKFLDEYMEANAQIPHDEVDEMRRDFNQSLDRCVIVFQEDVFIDTTKRRRRQSMVYYDLLMHSFSKLSNDVAEANKQDIKDAFTRLCQSQGFQRTLSGGLQNKSSIVRRRQLWDAALREVTGQDTDDV